jgi:antitoxin CcdA
MSSIYDLNAPKKPTSLTINSDLLHKAKDHHMNISSVLEIALAEKLKQKMKEEWLIQNGEAISIYNKHIEDNGVFSDELRDF